MTGPRRSGTDGRGGLSDVVAVVLTYRRRRLATEVVRGLLDVEGFSADHVILVVNGEGGLDDPALEAAVQVIRLEENLGPAAGFRAGMAAAARRPGVEWIYLCEDDVGLFGLPAPRVRRIVDRVEAVDGLDHRPVGAVVAYGRDLMPLTGHTAPHRVLGPDGFDEVDAATWGASLLSRRVVDAGILPEDAFFFGFEDFDFWYRVQAAGFRLLLDRASAVGVERHQSLDGRDLAFRGERPVDADEPWRAFYVARNYFLLSRRHGSPGWIAAHLVYSVRRLQLAASWAERRAILHGIAAGALGRTGKDPRYLREVGELDKVQDSQGRGAPRDTDAGTARARRVLHVLPNDIARGGQVIARDLVAGLDSPGDEHRILTLFRSHSVLLDPDYCLGVPMGRLRDLGFDPRAYRRLREALRLLRPSVVVAHGGEPLKYLSWSTRGRVPLVYFAFGIVTEGARHGARRLLYRSLMRRADAVAGISHETVEEARRVFDVRESRLVMLPNSRDPAVYAPHHDGRREAGAPVTLLFVGHLTATKRPERFVELVRELRRRGHPVRGLVVGDGPLEAEVRRLAEGAGVEVLGRRMDVPDILASADVFAFTSVPESEGMPGVLIEAGMAGVPVVATKTPGATTVIAEGETGYVVPFDDFDALVGAVEKLVLDPDRRAAMGAAARRRCEHDFSLEVVHRGWRTLLDSLSPRLPTAEPAASRVGP